MYEYLKDLLPVAELVGEPKEIQSYSRDRIWGDRVSIKGTTQDGRVFELELMIKEAQKDDD